VRGVGYGGGRSLDIVMVARGGDAVLAEVKNWSIATWASAGKRRGALDQLDRHDAAISEILLYTEEAERVRAKVLIVRREPFLEELREDLREDFADEVLARGWRILSPVWRVHRCPPITAITLSGIADTSRYPHLTSRRSPHWSRPSAPPLMRFRTTSRCWEINSTIGLAPSRRARVRCAALRT
jgi:hypothetical protein